MPNVQPKRSSTQQLRRLLLAEGYRPRPKDGNPQTIHFKVEGNTFLVRCNDDDPDFVQICTGYTLEDTTGDELTLLRAAVDVQNDMKVAKVYIPPNREYVEFQLELFLDGQPLSAGLLERCIATLRATCNAFYKRVTPPAPQARA